MKNLNSQATVICDETLSIIQLDLDKLVNSDKLIQTMGEANAQKLRETWKDARDSIASTSQHMEDEFKEREERNAQTRDAITDADKLWAHRNKNALAASTLINAIEDMQKIAEHAEKQANSSDIAKVVDVLKSALKVVVTLGQSKSAKLEFSAATFALNNKSSEKFKKQAKRTSKHLSKAKTTSKALNKAYEQQKNSSTRSR